MACCILHFFPQLQTASTTTGAVCKCRKTEYDIFTFRFYFLRGFINTLCSRRLDALGDFQNLNKTDMALFPTQLVAWLVDSMHQDERQQAERLPELKRLILKVSRVSRSQFPSSSPPLQGVMGSVVMIDAIYASSAGIAVAKHIMFSSTTI